MEKICIWLENTSIATAVRESALLFPWIESTHVIAITMLLGLIAIMDARLLGLLSKEDPVTQLAEELLPWVWVAFILAVVTGGLMFSSTALKYISNGPFQFKMMLLVAAGFNMIIFHFVTYRRVTVWDRTLPTPLAARIAGGASLVLWMSIVAVGRYIGFTLN